MMLSNAQAAEFGVLVQYAMDMHIAARDSLTTPPDPRLSPRWKIVGYITGTDCIFRAGRTAVLCSSVCYGYVATDGSMFVAVIRGTEGILEWIEDGQFLAVPHPVAGRVESGFFGVYSSLKYQPVGGGPVAVSLGIAHEVDQGELIVLGHSLGSALATYLTFDLAASLGDRVQGCFFASPRTGNADFAKAFDARVNTYQVWNYELDVVPRIPRGPDYTDLPRVTWIGIEAAQAKISFDLACHHHVLCYAAMLDYDLLNWSKMPPADRACAACIRGPAKIAA